MKRYVIFLTIILLLTGCGPEIKSYTAVGTVMGTILSQQVYLQGDGREAGEITGPAETGGQAEREVWEEADITARIETIVLELEQDMLSWRIEGSEIAIINAAAGSGDKVLVSDALFAGIETLLAVSAESGGAFDITMGPVVRLWNIDEWAAGNNTGAQIPGEDEIAEALAHTGYESIMAENGSIWIPAQMQLDMGAVGKGIACDRIAAFLKEQAAYGAVISVGGSVLTFGEKPDGTPWQVGIVNPLDTSSMLGTLSLEGQWCISTSGDYERYVEADGIRYHHILDPATGYPAQSGICSATVLCKSGILSDALSTACFILGAEEGIKLAQSYGAEVLLVEETGNIIMTDGMKSIFRKTGEN